jgi:hypothetical protein
MRDLPPSPPELSDDPNPEAGPPAFDKAAARARYRKLMRSTTMRLKYAITVLVILTTWGLGIAAAYAPDVKQLAGHDLSVPVAACKSCHNAGLSTVPTFNHSYAPSCGFCHRQDAPPLPPAAGRVR